MTLARRPASMCAGEARRSKRLLWYLSTTSSIFLPGPVPAKACDCVSSLLKSTSGSKVV